MDSAQRGSTWRPPAATNDRDRGTKLGVGVAANPFKFATRSLRRSARGLRPQHEPQGEIEAHGLGLALHHVAVLLVEPNARGLVRLEVARHARGLGLGIERLQQRAAVTAALLLGLDAEHP